jgi:hypothetical protein
MSLSSAKCYVRTLTAAAATFMLVATAAYSEKTNPFTKFGGNWVGSGLIYLSNGSKERIRCRTAITPADLGNIANLKLELRCAGDSYNFEIQSDLNNAGSAVTGTWTEKSRGINGNVTGTVNEEKINAVAESQTFQATLEIINQAEGKLQIRITSPGSEMTDVLIGLNRSAR